jgi:ribosome biogenesis protein YTM1
MFAFVFVRSNKKKGLSEIINHLLGLEPKVPFDFLIDGQFLRTSLKQWRRSQGTERSVVAIEYVKALVAPTEHKDTPHPDWIKSVAAAGQWVLTGSFDSSLRVLDAERDFREVACAPKALEKREVWDSRWLGGPWVLCGGKSCSARLFEWTGKQLIASGPTMVLDASVTQVCGAPDGPGRCAVTTASGGMHFYELELIESGAATEQPSKRRKEEPVAVPLAAALSLQGHRESISALQWRENGRAMTASLDHSAKIWDIDSNVAVTQLACAKAVTAADWSAAQSAVITAHSDGVIGLWDTRSGQGDQRRFKSHTGQLSCFSVTRGVLVMICIVAPV